MLQGLNLGRTCGSCKWCPGPPAAVPCNWRFGMYTGDKFPPRCKVTMHALNPATMGYPVVVAQPLNAKQGIPKSTMEWLVWMSQKLPVVVLNGAAHNGGTISLILTPDETKRQQVAFNLGFLLPKPEQPVNVILRPQDESEAQPLGTNQSTGGDNELDQ